MNSKTCKALNQNQRADNRPAEKKHQYQHNPIKQTQHHQARPE
jgi:hypothetical protein